jgi:hypothetical protein
LRWLAIKPIGNDIDRLQRSAIVLLSQEDQITSYCPKRLLIFAGRSQLHAKRVSKRLFLAPALCEFVTWLKRHVES